MMHGYTKLVVWLLLLSSSSSYFGHGISDSDLQCLKDLKQSLIDPNGILEAGSENESPWNFTDSPMCDFIGVVCWNPFDDRVLSLRLGNLGLEGPFPRGLELCTSMTTLDLSGNNFTGPLPERISEQMPYVSFLDLSNNSFSGGIPASIMNMTYLNVLVLQHNQFTGGIPAINLSRLISFDVADNSLTGPVPDSLQGFPAGNFTGNPGLCGAPLGKKCKKRFRVRIHVRFIWIREMFVRIRKLLHRINDASIIGASAGFIFGFVVAFYFPHKFLFCGRLQPYTFRVCT
ncbi:probably inactive leucine-rich repeat receptor-like protein kinase At5g48380 [Hordeum vulgare subsp. vulgare]|uniref:Leucine-rich repeat-containing N-terminal plant-type domain-containing protein n=1 Tax=Hordeum vulgare subsp. vulgare TaxID=112509 RepID=M0YSR1_HORVV|nr:probably inactive leucine-rich repeat receptor-like protein kinase At5g48380 [Hordeum vulgare subsp. vulgare]XP_044977949.1 probably inactive leucine-rich repeat receptor-like protein kinase At5g48380 [Hordeum vulgare subsp. vulgare]